MNLRCLNYLWTRFDPEDPSTWPEDEEAVLAASARGVGGWHLAIAQAKHLLTIESWFNWKTKTSCCFLGAKFEVVYWRPLNDDDFPEEVE